MDRAEAVLESARELPLHKKKKKSRSTRSRIQELAWTYCESSEEGTDKVVFFSVRRLLLHLLVDV